ncbi:hypothetical protein ID866_12489 [Astraeus odoratus]|nr:hypothetical protein ID866_12489 [Astraeus odoratus]
MFSLPVPNNEEVEGSSDELPIHLPGVRADEFRLLLKVLLTSSFGSQGNLPNSPDEWLSVIKLARMWEMDEVCKKAIKMMPYSSVNKNAVEKVRLAFQYDIDEWLVPGLNELAKRPEPVSVKDVELLGWEIALKVVEVRESLVISTQEPQESSRSGKSATTPATRLSSGIRDASGVDFTSTIERVFKLWEERPRTCGFVVSDFCVTHPINKVLKKNPMGDFGSASLPPVNPSDT